MIIPIDPNREIQWAASWERDPDGNPLPDASVFLIGPPDDRYRAEILNAAAAMGRARSEEGGARDIKINTGSVRRKRLRGGLRGVVRNFPGWEDERDDMGGPRRVPTAAFLSTLPDTLAAEMETAIAELTDVPEDVVGKSDAPSGQPTTESTATSAEDAPG